MPRTTNPGHLAKQFSSAVFSAFLSDLADWDDEPRPQLHAAVSRWLEELTNLAATIPDGGLLGRKVHQRCADVAKAYHAWHASERGAARSKARDRLRKRVNALATAYRVRTKLLEEEVDLATPRAMVEATTRLLLSVPDACVALGKVVHRFARRIPGSR